MESRQEPGYTLELNRQMPLGFPGLRGGRGRWLFFSLERSVSLTDKKKRKAETLEQNVHCKFCNNLKYQQFNLLIDPRMRRILDLSVLENLFVFLCQRETLV